MRLANVQPGDVIRANVRGREFTAIVDDLECPDIPRLPIRVTPLAANCTHFHLAASQIRERIDPPPRHHRRSKWKPLRAAA